MQKKINHLIVYKVIIGRQSSPPPQLLNLIRARRRDLRASAERRIKFGFVPQTKLLHDFKTLRIERYRYF